jgi:hypothetical protein
MARPTYDPAAGSAKPPEWPEDLLLAFPINPDAVVAHGD